MKEELKKALEKATEIYGAVEDVDVRELKMFATAYATSSVGGRVHIISERIINWLERDRLAAVFVPEQKYQGRRGRGSFMQSTTRAGLVCAHTPLPKYPRTLHAN